MQIAVAYRKNRADAGARLRDDLARRLSRDDVALAWDGDPFDLLVALIGPETFAPGAEEDRVRRALARAVAEDARIVLVAVEGAEVPEHEALPPQLAPIGDLDPITASSDDWDPAVGRVVRRIDGLRPQRRSGLASVLRARPRVSIVAAVGVVGGIVSILAAFGIIPPTPDPTQTGRIDVRRGTDGLTYEEFLASLSPAAREEAASSPPPTRGDGREYVVDVTLVDPEHDRYSLRWTWRDHEDGHPLGKPVVGLRFDAENSTGIHRLWVPCPPRDAIEFDVEFQFFDDSPPGKELARESDSEGGDCVIVEA